MPEHARPAAPKADRTLLAVPSFEEWRDALSSNRNRLETGASIAGQRLSDLREQARQDLLAAASKYLADYRSDMMVSLDAKRPFVVTGHQPELFHPGVWIKSFATARFAQSVDGLPIHVIIDNDTMKASAIRVPAGGPERFIVGHVPFDKWEGEIPYEERNVVDESVFRDFPTRVRATMSKLPFTPIVDEFWSHVSRAAEFTDNIGERFAYGRRKIENDFGIQNVEVTLSRLCGMKSFYLFVGEVIARIEEFQSIYNGALSDYRAKYKMRSRNHPASDLDIDDDWWETPFWIWHPVDTHRSVLWIRLHAGKLELRANDIAIASLSIGDHPSAEEIADALARGFGNWKIRPRAMITTLYLRLLVGDWFIHGLGGGKYDEVTDEISRRFWSIDPPQFAILTATLRLPSTRDQNLSDQWAKNRRLARDLYWNPDRHLDDQLRERAPVSTWIEELESLRGSEPRTHADRYRRFHSLRAVVNKIRPFVEAERHRFEELGHDLSDRLRSDQSLESRDYAFCLHPRESLAALMTQIPDFFGT